MHTQCFSQDHSGSDTIDVGGKILADIKYSFRTTSKYLNSPGTFEAKDWIATIGVVATTTFFIFTFDEPIRKYFQSENLKNLSKTVAPFLNVSEYYGRFYLWLGAGAITYAVGVLADFNELRIIGQNLIEAVGLSTLSVVLLKVAFGRSRPFTNEIPSNFNGFNFDYENGSFPSLHAATTFAAATILTVKLKKWWLSVPLYVLSLLTVVERLQRDEHWFSDVFFGAVIGTFTGILVGTLSDSGDDFSLQKLGLEVDEEIIRKNNLIIDKERDDMEWDLATDFLKLKKPILGICRGMQLMNLVLGGSIYLDITEQHASCESHTSISDLISRKHKIYLNKESILSRSLGVTEGTVNSRHHQAVNKVARTLKIGAKSPDGIIEALEDESGRILLVQWHPELLYEEDRTTSFGLDILKLFINQVIISRSN
ncbi:hypothetical protein CHS0354_023880 [Potamilus streckersoni]|uniref:Phosphatidic acid phosphatase type 2/haloperoxidase domain-containing protein n=1 Tax=Potamilus streckersoni TaxID=2493646 RepID=A0AAE0RZE2_9BIVA|nr:hypothetical protein CHS0354_023880 [Potamilus streckersoni]